MRSLLVGIFAGLVLSTLRAPLGLELLQLPATAPGAAMAFRAGALLAIAVGLILGFRDRSQHFSPFGLLIGTAAGFQAHWQTMDSPSPVLVQGLFSVLLVSLLVAGHTGGPEVRPRKLRIVFLALAALIGWYLIDLGHPEGHAEAVLALILGTAAIVIVARCTDTPAPEASEDTQELRPPRGGLTAIAIGGGGLAILAEGIARHLRLLGGGSSVDDSVFTSTFLALAAFGGLAFARSLRERRSVLLGRGVVLSLGGLAAWGSFRVLENLAHTRGLENFLRRFELIGVQLDLSQRGMLNYDLAVAAPVLVVPAFVVGTAVCLFRRPAELAALLLGAAAGLALSPDLMEFAFDLDAVRGEPALLHHSSSAQLVLFGGTVAAIGGLLSFLTSPGLDRPRRLVGCLVAFGGIALCRFPERPPIEILSPWGRREPQPVLVLDAPCGLLTVETDTGGTQVVTLDRRRLTPETQDEAADIERLQTSWRLLGDRPEGAETGVLLVGQLTPGRALVLSDLGATRIDRTAAWQPAMEAIEHVLFEGPPNWVPGEVLTTAEARRRLNGGDYDLVIVPPVEGPPPTTRNLASPESSTVAVWLDGSSGVETQHLGETLLLQAPRLMQLFVAVVRAPQIDELRLAAGFGAPGFLAGGDPVSAWPAGEALGTRIERRGDLLRGRLARRLAEAERTPGPATALALHFEAQDFSSPFETPEEQVELDTESLRLISQAAAGPEPSFLVQRLAEDLSVLLRAQRKVEEIDTWLAGPAERHQPWPPLELALAHAALELLDPEAAVTHLETALAGAGGNAGSWAMLAEAQQQAGDDAGAARSLERASQMAPESHALQKRLAIAWRRSGDPRGPAALTEALREHPEDEELLAHQGPGPYPPVPLGFHPLVEHDHGDGHDH